MSFLYNDFGDKVKIYLDLIMLLNFGIDFILLTSVSIILKRNVSINRLLIGSFIGGLSILFLFINISSLILFIYKVLISTIMIIITFKYINIRYTLINLGYLYMSSIVLGGFLYLLNLEFSLKHIGIIFINNGLSINFIFLLITNPIILYIYVKQIKKLKYNYNNYYDIEIYINKNKYKYIGYFDTGNVLKDNLTGKPVILIDKRKVLFKILSFRLIPYTSINKKGLIKIIKPDKVIFNNKEYDVLLGIVDNISIDGVDIILNRYLMEG